MATIGHVSTVEGETVIEWKIRNFFALSIKCDKGYYSPNFSFCNESLYLSIWPNGQTMLQSIGSVDLLLHRDCPDPGPPITLKYSLGLKTQNGSIKKVMDLENIFEYDEEEMYGYGDTCISRSELLERKSEFAPHNCLTVVCKIKYLKSAEVKSFSDAVTFKCSYCQKVLEDAEASSHLEKCMDKPIKCPECADVVELRHWYDHKCHEKRKEGCNSTSSDPVSLSGAKALADLKELFLMQEGCDITIKVKDQEFQAHKAILRARSSVFASAFRHDMKEKKTNSIEIEDCDPSSFPDFLSFLYCGNVEKLSAENAFTLFVTADKYDVQDLRLQCLDFMKNNLSSSTFCKAVTLALQYTEEQLLQLSIDFLAKNLQEVIMTVEWQSLLLENPIQCNELTIKALNCNKK